MTPVRTLVLCLLLAATPAAAGPGHDHDHDHGAAPQAALPTLPRLESSGSELELVATVTGHKLKIYLDRAETNEPVNGAAIEVSGNGIATAAAKAAGDGTYEVDAEWADKPVAQPLIFVVSAEGTTELLNGVLEIPQPAEGPAQSTRSWTDVLTSPLTWSLAAVAGLFGFFISFAFRPLPRARDEESSATPVAKPSATLKGAAQLILAAALFGALLPTDGLAHSEGEHETQATETVGGGVPRRLQDGSVFLPKPSQRLMHIRTEVARDQTAVMGHELIGTVVPDPSSFGRVQAPMDGRIELSGRGISHVGQRVAEGEVLALLSPTIPVADLGTMQQLTAEVEGKLKIAEQKLARLTRIASVIAQKDIDDTKAELDALREQKRVLAPKDAERIELKAPVSGVIAVANVRAGQVVTARDTLFEIVDPDRLWIEAIGIAGHDAIEIAAANATDADGHVIRLSYIGRAPALRQQSLPLQFKVEEEHEGLLIGSALKVFVQQGEPRRGIVLPDAAVVRGANGLSQVWEKVSAEEFKPVPVRTAPLDGARILILGGIEAGSRIVVDGAELINQVR